MADSVTKRYLITLLFTFGRSGLNFVTGLLLARFLGPSDFGTMAFLLGTFLALRQLLDMGTAQAFFTFMSQKIRSKFFVFSYFGWLIIEFFLVILVIKLFLPDSWIEAIWKGEHKTLIVLAFAAAFLQNSIWPSVQQALEAQRQTYKSQWIGLIIAFCHSCALLTLWLWNELGLAAIFIAIFIEYSIALVVALRFLTFSNYEDRKYRIESLKDFFNKYLEYCKPLIIYSCLAFLYSFADTWMLQNFGGSINQAYYTVSAKIAGNVILTTASFINIFYKELEEAYHQKKFKYLASLYLKFSRLLFFIGACISCFFIPWAKDLLSNILGESYLNGSLTLVIMFFYPIHQSMGQIGSSFLFATGKVGIQVTIGIFFMLLSMLVTYFVLAEENSIISGLGLGSLGLALKMVLMQLIQVNVMAFFISKSFKIKYDWNYQFSSILICLGFSYLSYFWITNLTIFNNFDYSFFIKIGLTSLCYFNLILIFLWNFPNLVGFNRLERTKLAYGLKRKIKNIIK